MGTSHLTGMRELWATIGGQAALRGIAARRRRVAIESILSAMGDRQLDDLGLRRGDIAAYAVASALAPRLVVRMLAARRPDLRWDGLAPAVRESLLKACRVCHAAKACRRWAAGSGQQGAAPAFYCPNGAVLERLPALAADALDHRDGPVPSPRGA